MITNTMIRDESDEEARKIDHMIGAANDLARVAQHNLVGVFGQTNSTKFDEATGQEKENYTMAIQERDYSPQSFTHLTKWIEPEDLRHVRRKEEIKTHT